MQFNFVWIKGQKHKKTVNVSDSDEDEYKNSGLVYDSEDSDFDVDDVDEVSYFVSEKLLKTYFYLKGLQPCSESRFYMFFLI